MEGDELAGRPGFRPSHPGRILRRSIDAMGLTIEAFADHIGVSRQTVHAILAERSKVSADVAARLGRALGTSGQFWLNLQSKHDVWAVEEIPEIRRIANLVVPRRSVLQASLMKTHGSVARAKSEITGRKVASAASKVLHGKSASAVDKAVAASALTQSKSKKEATSKSVASKATKILKDPKTSKEAKSVAASALTQKTKK